ncbi:hypothetical protein [Ferruginibacter sp.]|nr:hypothetical protein [Ferruginibacter sp.]
MILPNNGKVVIVDDVYADVKHLILALTKERMPFLFFQDVGGDDLPPNGSPIENIRLVFLDLDLGVGGIGEMEMIRVVQGRLVRILKKNTPYVLVIWSNHEEKLSKTLLNEFEGDFKDYKPIAHCSLDKSIIKSTDSKKVVETIRESLKDCLKQFQSFNAFLLWESLVTQSSGEIVDGFTKIFDFDASWDNNIKGFFYRLAKANVGVPKVYEISNEKKLQLALETINSALIDSIEKNIKAAANTLPLNIKEENTTISSKNLVDINTKLHLLFSKHLDHFEPGNIYFPPLADDIMVAEVIKATFDKKYVEEIIKTKPQTIKIDITPICDYSQDKGYTRLLSGILVEGKYKEFKKSSTQIYVYDLCPVMDIFGNNYYMIFDFRYFKSLKKEIIESLFQKPYCKIRAQLLADVQSGLSNHINRPGIVNVV